MTPDQYKYRPDKQEAAVLLVIQQAELFATERAAYPVLIDRSISELIRPRLRAAIIASSKS
jgi:hypothetical protein